MSRRSNVIIGVILGILAIALLIYFTRWRDASGQGAAGGTGGPGGAHGGRSGGLPVPVRAIAAADGSIDVTLDALGNVTARNTAVVHSRVDGLLNRINFEEGREVKAGTRSRY